MIEFETDLQDLRTSSTDLADAAQAAYNAAKKIKGLDVPSGPIVPGIFGDVATVDNAFGSTLGMPRVAQSYNAHAQVVADLVGRLYQSAVDASHALRAIADVYEQAEDHGAEGIRRAGGPS